MPAAADQLGTSTLCRLSPAQMQAAQALPEPLRRRARHVITEHQRTVAASDAMRAGALDTFAKLMTESHRSYSQDFEASTPEIDDLVRDAVETGAKGGRLTGGGFGGCIIVLHEASALEAWFDRFLARHPKVWRV